jgi:hypothetical protein
MQGQSGAAKALAKKNVFTLQLLAHFLVCRTEHRQLMPLCCLHLSVLRGHHQTCTILSLAHATERSNVNKTSHQQILNVNLGNKNGTAYTRTHARAHNTTQHSTHTPARAHTHSTQHNTAQHSTTQHSTTQHSTAHTHARSHVRSKSLVGKSTNVSSLFLVN